MTRSLIARWAVMPWIRRPAAARATTGHVAALPSPPMNEHRRDIAVGGSGWTAALTSRADVPLVFLSWSSPGKALSALRSFAAYRLGAGATAAQRPIAQEFLQAFS